MEAAVEAAETETAMDVVAVIGHEEAATATMTTTDTRRLMIRGTHQKRPACIRRSDVAAAAVAVPIATRIATTSDPAAATAAIS